MWTYPEYDLFSDQLIPGLSFADENHQNQCPHLVSGEDTLKNINILLWSKKIYFCQFCKNYKDAHPTMIYFCSWMIYICIFLFLLENDDGIEWCFRCCVTTDPVIIWAAAIWDMNNWSWKWWPVFVNNAGHWGNIAGAGPSFDCLGAATCEWAHNGQSRLLRIN